MSGKCCPAKGPPLPETLEDGGEREGGGWGKSLPLLAGGGDSTIARFLRVVKRAPNFFRPAPNPAPRHPTGPPPPAVPTFSTTPSHPPLTHRRPKDIPASSVRPATTLLDWAQTHFTPIHTLMPQLPPSFQRLREAVRPYYLRHVYFPLCPDRRPPEFLCCWHAPHEFQHRPTSLDIPPPDSSHPDVLFLPMTDWHHRLQRTQHLALALAGLGHRCFLLNPHLGREYAAAPWRRRPPALAQLQSRVFEIHAPLPAEPVFHHRLLRPAEFLALADSIHWALHRAGVRRLAIVVSLPTWLDCALLLRQRWTAPMVYDCHDWLAGFSNMPRALVDAEPRCMQQADAVIFSAASLQDRFCQESPSLAAKAFLLRNGVPDWPTPPGERTAAPVAGYVGALEEWFWTEAVAAAAQALPEVRFLLAGTASAPVRRALGGFPNVELRGEVPHHDVPNLLEQCRVGLIPFRGQLIHYTDPLKVYEYFHHGLPVAAGRMPELDRFGDLVHQASTPEGFVEALKISLSESDPARDAARRRFARQARWRHRAESLSRLLAQVAEHRSHASS